MKLFDKIKNSIVDPWHCCTDLDSRIRSPYRIHDLRIRILLFSLVTFKMPAIFSFFRSCLYILNLKKAVVTDGICQVYFELDLTNAYTIAALTSCQLLPRGLNLSQVRYRSPLSLSPSF
jgi:hypothetical protein